MPIVSLELNISNPYVNGEIVDYGNQEFYLENNNPLIIKSPNDRLYEIEEGDELSTIAFLAYGNSKWWWLIYMANPQILFHPLNLPIGQKLLIPDMDAYLANN